MHPKFGQGAGEHLEDHAGSDRRKTQTVKYAQKTHIRNVYNAETEKTEKYFAFNVDIFKKNAKYG